MEILATPLYEEFQQSHADVCTMLLEHNANVNKKNEKCFSTTTSSISRGSC